MSYLWEFVLTIDTIIINKSVRKHCDPVACVIILNESNVFLIIMHARQLNYQSRLKCVALDYSFWYSHIEMYRIFKLRREIKICPTNFEYKKNCYLFKYSNDKWMCSNYSLKFLFKDAELRETIITPRSSFRKFVKWAHFF